MEKTKIEKTEIRNNTDSAIRETEGGGGKRNADTKKPIDRNNGLVILKDEKKKKKKPKKKKTKEEDLGTLQKNISSLISSGFTFASMRIGEHWEISDEESQAISEPLSNIMNRFGINEKASEYMDFISLITALAIITIPRALITQQEKKEKQGGLKIEKPSKGSINKNTRNDNGEPTKKSFSGKSIENLFSEMP